MRDLHNVTPDTRNICMCVNACALFQSSVSILRCNEFDANLEYETNCVQIFIVRTAYKI